MNEAKSFLSPVRHKHETGSLQSAHDQAPRQLTLASSLGEAAPSTAAHASDDEDAGSGAKKRKRDQTASTSSSSPLQANASEWYHMVCSALVLADTLYHI